MAVHARRYLIVIRRVGINMYVGVMTNYWCNECAWFATITQPAGYYLKVHCPDCDALLEIVDSDANKEG